jgi:DNA-binding MarR family transcriptional regulator
MDLSRSLGFLVNRLARAMTVQFDRRLQPHGITTSQWAILALLWREDGQTQSQLQQALGLEAATVTGIVGRMESRGFVLRRREPSDHRVRRIVLTEAGRALEDHLPALARHVNALALRGLSSDEREALTRLLARALDNLETGDRP